MIGRIFGGIWRGLDGLRKFLHLVLLLTIFGFVVGALRTSIPHIADHSALVHRAQGRDRRAAHRQPGRPGAGARAGRAAGRDAALGSHRRAQGREERRAHQGGRPRSQLHVGWRPADARGIHRGHQGFPQLGQEGGRARHRVSCRRATTSPRRPTRSISIRWASSPSTATSAIAPTTRISSTSSASRSTCSASAPTRAPPKSTCAPTCRPKIARKASRT